MSVTSRTAAKSRTAARKRGKLSRCKLVASWLLIVPTLSFFSFTVVAGASTFGGSEDYGAAVQELGMASSSQVVVVQSSTSKTGGLFSAPSKVVCSVTKSQLSRISAAYRTGSFSVGSTTVITVYGATDSGLRSYLGAAGLTCKLVQVKKVFYLPFDAHGS
jgi:hypothetical protein